MKRRPTDRTLRRWLATGRPARVGRWIDADRDVAERIDGLSALSSAESVALDEFVTPAPQFEHRTTAAVQERVDKFGTASAMVDLLGLGFHVGRAVLGDRRVQTRIDDSSESPDEQHGDETSR